MATVTELFAERTQVMESSGQYSSLELVYMVKDVSSTSDYVYIGNTPYPASEEHFALSAVREHAPTAMYGMARRNLRIADKVDNSTYKVTVTYEYSGSSSPGSEDSDRDAGDRTIQFSGSVGQRHLTHALRIIKKSSHLPDDGGAINRDHDGTIHGVDVVSPQLTFSETHYFTYKTFTISYIKTLYAMQGTVNNAAFRGFEKGEVRFDTFSASRRGTKRSDLYEVTYSFTVIPNQASINQHGLEIPAKEGHDYLWLHTVNKQPGDGSKLSAGLISDVDGYYIGQVYPRANFARLKIKTSAFSPIGDD
jgi:hypothetical protein